MGSILPCRLPFGNAGGLQILRCQEFEVKYYDVTLDALTLKPSDVCNVGVKSMDASAGIINIFSIHSNGGCALLGQLNKSKYILDLFEIIAHLQEREGIH
jgi:hypothetical protein